MANEIPPMIVEILVETDKLKAGLANVQSQLEKVGSGAEKTKERTHGLKGQFDELGKKLFKGLGLLEIANFMQESAKAASEDASSLAILNKTLQTTTGATKAQSAAVNEHLESMAEQSGVMMNQMRPAFDVLVRSTKDSTKALQLQQLALDVAAGAHKPVQAVAMALSRAYNGNSNALNRLVPDVKNVGDKLGYLSKNFKGAAKAAGDADPMSRFHVAMEKIKVTLGQALLPLLNALIKILLPLMPVFDLLAKVVAMVVKAIAPLIQKIMTALMPAFMAIAKVLTPIIKNILPPLIRLLDKVLLPILGFVSDIIVNYLVPYLTKLSEVFGGALSWAVDVVVGSFQKMLQVLGPLWQYLKPIIDGVMAMMGIKVEPVIKPKLDTSDLTKIKDLTSSDLGGMTNSTAKSGLVTHAQAVQKELLKSQADYQKAVKAANDQYAADVKAQIQAFRDQFKQATQINIGDLFAQGYRSADSLVSALQTKLAGIKNFANDAAKLAGAGFSSTFISQVMAQGPMMGDQMAQALLTATPDTAKQIQDLFAQTQDASQHGVDALSTSLKDQFVDATKALTDALKAATDTLNRSLSSLGASVTTQATVATGSVTGSSMAVAGAVRAGSVAGVGHNNIVINNNVQSNATADHIARVTVNSIKFGAPLTVPATGPYTGAQLKAQGIAPNYSGIPASPTH